MSTPVQGMIKTGLFSHMQLQMRMARKAAFLSRLLTGVSGYRKRNMIHVPHENHSSYMPRAKEA